jgi:two-component system CheB/CheR fusion protein
VDNVIRGVVLTFTDVSKRIEAEAAARSARELAQRIVDMVREPMLVLDGSLRVVSASRALHQVFGTTPQATTGQLVYDVADRRWDLPGLRERLEQVLPRDQAFERFEVADVALDGNPRQLYLDGRRIGGGAGSRELILLTFGDQGPPGAPG